MGIELGELRQFLIQRQIKFTETEVQHGVKLTCSTGEIFIHYSKRGNVVVQGRQSTALSQAVQQWKESGLTPGMPVGPSDVDEGEAAPSAQPGAGLSKDVFVVYGHDSDARDKLELLLRRMGLNPIVLLNLPAGGDTIIEKLERYLGAHSNVGFACVLLTPDDEGFATGHEDQRKYRARQNVILELGMVLARLGRPRVAILHKGSVELPSDINGLLYIPFAERVDEVASQLYKELCAAGYQASLP
jgi:predicted nucleotide-binding protein